MLWEDTSFLWKTVSDTPLLLLSSPRSVSFIPSWPTTFVKHSMPLSVQRPTRRVALCHGGRCPYWLPVLYRMAIARPDICRRGFETPARSGSPHPPTKPRLSAETLAHQDGKDGPGLPCRSAGQEHVDPDTMAARPWSAPRNRT